MFTINPLALRYIFIAGVILFYTFVVYHHGHKSGVDEVTAEWHTEKMQLQAEYDKQLADAQAKEKKQNEITSKIQTAYNRDTRILAERLRDLPATCTVTMPGDTESATGTGAATTDTISYRQVDAIMDLNQCSKLIEWVKAQY